MINFFYFLILKKCYYILNETNDKEIVGGVVVGKIYYGSGSGDYRFSGNNFQS